MKSAILTWITATILFAGLTIQAGAANPVPFINQPLVPDAIKQGNAGFTLIVNGSGFVSGSVVHWNGSSRNTVFVSKSQLAASILSSDIAKPTTPRVTVVNPGPGGGISNVVFFQITPPTSSIVLSSPLHFNAGFAPRSPVIADFNGDGRLDLVLSNTDDASISVLLGRGDGTFQSAGSFGAGPAPISVAVGDFNRDGKLDLAVANYGTNYASILLGNGDGTFKAAVSYDAGSYPVSVAVGDFNGDGNLDLAVANQASNNVSVLLGNGDGTFQPAVDYGAGSTLDSVTVGDFNEDGKLDLVVANYGSNNVSVLLGNGDGTFRTAVNYPVGLGPDSVVTGDVNQDGKLDLLVTNNCGTSSSCGNGSVGVLLGNGDGTFRTAVNYEVGSFPGSLALGDLNGDRKLDVVVDNGSVLLGKGDGTFQSPLMFQGGGSIAVGDFNGDGRLDLAVGTTDGVSTLLQAPRASLSSANVKFAVELIGTSSTPKALTLTNAGVLPLSINNITVTGTDPTDFGQINTCSSSLPAGASCRINITFKPTQIGPRTATVEITDNEFGSPQLVALSGIGATSGPNATLSGSSLTFQTQLVGTTSPAKSVTLSNYGIMPLNISVTVSGDFRQTNTCGSSLAPGASCTISISFRPTQIGTRTGKLSITDNAPGSPQSVSLSGTGTVVELNPKHLAFSCSVIFPNRFCTCSSPETTTLTNVGSTPLSITGITITGPFSIETNTCDASVGAGKSCAITVNWSRSTGSGAVSISDNGGVSPQMISLTGNKQCTPP